jgi:hypothetical protein
MYEYNFFDGDHFITFDIVEINDDNETVLVAISNQGRITQDTFDLLEDEALDGICENRYFEYGLYQDKIYINDFVNM